MRRTVFDAFEDSSPAKHGIEKGLDSPSISVIVEMLK